MRDGLFPTRRMTSLMRGPLGALPQRSALVVVIGLLLLSLAAGGAFANTPPLADAGPDQSVCVGEPVMLMGWAEDPDGDPIACWDWAIDSAPEGSLADLPDFTLPDPLFLPDLPGDYLLSLVVTDGTDCSLPDTVTIHVTEEPPPLDAATMDAITASDPIAETAEARMMAGWGLNCHCQCDAPPNAQSGVIAIAAGGYHSLALTADGEVIAWGWNYFSQCNVPADAQSGVIAIAAGRYHSLALTADGEVIAWGRNDFGQREVPADAQSGVTAIAAGGNHSLALTGGGVVSAWGRNDFGQLEVPPDAESGIIAIAGGLYHSLALTAGGQVIAWGYNGWGQCDTSAIPEGTMVTAISAGELFSLALTADGGVIAWGHNYGAYAVPPEAQSGVVAIAGGGLHSLALRSDGQVFAWGDNYYGQSTVPADAHSGIISIAGGYWHSLALTADGRAIAWGRNRYGQCTVPADAESGVIAIAAGIYHSLAVWADQSPESLLASLREFIVARVASGHIAPEMEGSLLAKVDAAIAALARGDPPGVKVVMNDLKALVNQVEAQTDKKIETATAAEIIARANSITAALGA